jgi:hypothetical protein
MFNETDGLFEVWTDDSYRLDRKSVVDVTDQPITLSPPKEGVRFRYFTVGPRLYSEDMSESEQRESVSKLFASVGSEGHQPDTTQHPAMHETPTVDCIILLKGEVKLILEEEVRQLKPFDMVIQRGTNHAWEVIGDEPALLVAVLIDRQFQDS